MYSDEDIDKANGQNIVDVAKELGIKMVVRGRAGRVLGEKVQWYYDNLKSDKGIC